MVNLEKWEEIKFGDVQKGDLIRRIITDAGGVYMDARGVAAILKTDYFNAPERWISATENGWIVARRTLNSPTAKQTYYRRKPARFRFPQNTAAVISANWKRTGGRLGTEVMLVQAPVGHWVSTATGISYTEDELLTNSENFTVLSEGATV